MPTLRPIAIVTVLLALVSFALGAWGFLQLHPDLSLTNCIYQSLQLFPLDGPKDQPSLPTSLEIARFLAPFSLVLGIGATIIHLSQDAFHRLLVTISNGHAIVVGLNTTSYRLILDTLSSQRKVVLITTSMEDPRIDELRARGAVCLTGRGTDTHLLTRARIHKASHLFAFTEDYVTNVEIVTAVSRATQQLASPSAPHQLRCILRFKNAIFQQAFMKHSLLNNPTDSIVVSLFNLHDLSARRTLKKYPLELDAQNQLQDDIALVIFGYSQAGMSLLHHALQVGHYRTRQKLAVTLVLSEQEACDFQQEQRIPNLEDIADLEILTTANNSPHSYLKAFVASTPSATTWHSLVCAHRSDSQNFALSQHLVTLRLQFSYRVLCHLPHSPGLASLLNTTKSKIDTHPIALADELVTWEHIVDESYDSQARMIHGNYVKLAIASGATLIENPSLDCWEAIPETLREQSRLQTDHLPVKLRAIGIDPKHLPSQQALTSQISKHLELLAEMEHLRWNAVHYLAGWSYAPGEKDPSLLTHPYLKPWDQLSENIKQYDRDAVMNIPQLLINPEVNPFSNQTTNSAQTITTPNASDEKPS